MPVPPNKVIGISWWGTQLVVVVYNACRCLIGTGWDRLTACLFGMTGNPAFRAGRRHQIILFSRHYF
jgi:hypothetical protein